MDLAMFPSTEVADSLDLNLPYDITPPVFLISTSTGGAVFTLGWREETYNKDFESKCDACKEEEFDKYRAVQKSVVPHGDEICVDEDYILNNSHIATPGMMICEACAKEIDDIIDQLIEENPVESVIDQI